MQRAFISWHGHRIHVVEVGHGEPLLLISGLGSNTGMWRPFMEYFPHRRIIRFDAPGTGRSSTPLCPVPVSSLADLAETVLDDRGVSRTDVVGYSYGGAVAQQLAYDHPKRIRRLVLAATTCGVGATLGSPQAIVALSTPLRYYSPGYFNRIAGAAFGGRTGRDTAMRHKMLSSRKRQPPSYYGYAMQLLGGSGWSSLPFLSQIPHATLVISGDDDPLVPLANPRLLADLIPDARLEIIRDGGHLFLWDDAERVVTHIVQFLDRGKTEARPARSRRLGNVRPLRA